MEKVTMSEWPKYESHKTVQAAKIIAIDNHDKSIWVRPAGEKYDGVNIEKFEPTVPAMAEKAEIGGYAVLYSDGFKSISPAKAFEEGYSLHREDSA